LRAILQRIVFFCASVSAREMLSHREKILDQLRNGKRSWTLDDVQDRNPDVFYTEVVCPLRNLHSDGYFVDYNEHYCLINGRACVDRVDVLTE
jgi:hypothetical protein